MKPTKGSAGDTPNEALVWLEVVEGPGQGSVFPLYPGRPAVVGRGPLPGIPQVGTVDIPIPYVGQDRRHCEVQWDGCRV